jgi:hypothetical protein
MWLSVRLFYRADAHRLYWVDREIGFRKKIWQNEKILNLKGVKRE